MKQKYAVYETAKNTLEVGKCAENAAAEKRSNDEAGLQVVKAFETAKEACDYLASLAK